MACCLYSNVHISKLKGNSLVILDLGAKSLAYLGIFQCQFISSCCDTQSLCRYANTSSCQGFHCELEAKAILPDPVLLGHLYVSEHKGMRIAPADPQFLLLGSDCEALPAFFYYECIYTFMPLFHIRLG